MHKLKEKKRSASSQLSFNCSNQKQTTSNTKLSNGGASGHASHRRTKSKDGISSRSQTSLHSKEKKQHEESVTSQTDRKQATGHTPLTPLLNNIIVHRSKQGSHDSKAAKSIFHQGTKD